MAKEWTFQTASVHAKGPFNITLRVNGAAENAPFVWSVTVTDSAGSSLFQIEHDDRTIDQFFGDEGYIDECKGYQRCKNKWYFEKLPKDVASAVEIVDQSERLESYERDSLVELAGEFLKSKGVSTERREAVIEEMLMLRAGQFESLYVPEDLCKKVQASCTFRALVTSSRIGMHE